MQKEYTKQEAIQEANRCLTCKNPQCVKACPLGNNIPEFIFNIKQEDFDEAYKVLLQTTILSEVCSRVCPKDKHCVSHCIRGIKGEPININMLEKFVADYMHKEDRYLNFMNEIKENIREKKNIKVAVIGAGPSGIACSYYLIRQGYDVTIFEKEDMFGGILSYGIPEYRLPKDIVEKIKNKLVSLGVDIQFGIRYGKDISPKDLLENGYKAIFLGIGLEHSSKLNVEGQELENIYTGNEFLYAVNDKTRNKSNINLEDFKQKNVVVVGGGNVAVDSAISAKYLGAKQVTLLYRRSENELLIEKDEKKLADAENIKFEYLTLPVKYIGDKKVEKIECVKMKLGDADATGRRTPEILENTNFSINADYVIICVGSKINTADISTTKNLDYDDYTIKINEYGQTTVPYIFAGGDVSLMSNKTVAMAAHTGMIAGMGIDKYLSELFKSELKI